MVRSRHRATFSSAVIGLCTSALDMRLFLAGLLDMQKNYAAAEAEYREVLAQNPNNYVALNNLAYLLWGRKTNLPEALKCINRAIELAGPIANLRDTRAVILLAMGSTRGAQDDLDLAERLSRESIRTLAPLEDRGTLCEAQRRLAEVLLGKEKLDEAERWAEAALETVGAHDVSSRATTRATLARIRKAQGRPEEAVTLLRETIAIFEDTEYSSFRRTALRELAELLRELGRDDEAEPFERQLRDLTEDASAARV